MSADTRAVSDAPSAPPRRRSRVLGRRDSFRPEIQGLRAVAVLVVVLFHLWPNRLTGGYVGVDVFFVISGYLITGHIVREIDQTGTLRVTQFWARRIRRLLPASLLVLAVSTVAVVLVVPATVWAQTARQVAASALYVQNWALALDAVDYMAADNVPTVAQHYWSLSVEEQFYLVWPLLVLGLVAAARSLSRWWRPAGAGVSEWRLLVGGLAVTAVASLGWSVVSTAQDQPFAYMSTLTRVWEFAAGALAALLITGQRLTPPVRAVLGWLGVVAIVAAAATYDEESLFPGWIAVLPVAGAVAVIAAGRGGPWTAGGWLSLAPARFVGDISYSVYLWHWPLVVVVPYATGRDLTRADKLAVLAATLVLAWLSKVLVEDPLRVRPWLAGPPRRAMAFAVVGMLAVTAGSLAISLELDSRGRAASAQARQAQLEARECLGPRTFDSGRDCSPVVGAGPLLVSPEVVVGQNSDPPYRGCQQSSTVDDLKVCELGETRSPRRVVALVGDSHATQWFPAFDDLGKDRGWKVLTMTRSSCPFSSARRILDGEQTEDPQVRCEAWVDNARAALLADEGITDVVVTSYSTAYDWTSRPGTHLDDPGPDGFASLWADLIAAGKRVVVIAAVPRTFGENVPSCLAQNPDDLLSCAVPRDRALPGDVMLQAAERLDDPALRVVDLSDRFCDDSMCYPVVGNVIVYRDFSHLSAEYASLLVPYLAERAGLD
ncbi:MAG: acyltransferase family protein [Actinomycetes bacterium]